MKTATLRLNPDRFNNYALAQKTSGYCADGSCMGCRVAPIVQRSIELQRVFVRMVMAALHAVEAEEDPAKGAVAAAQIVGDAFSMGFICAYDMIEAAHLESSLTPEVV